MFHKSDLFQPSRFDAPLPKTDAVLKICTSHESAPTMIVLCSDEGCQAEGIAEVMQRRLEKERRVWAEADYLDSFGEAQKYMTSS